VLLQSNGFSYIEVPSLFLPKVQLQRGSGTALFHLPHTRRITESVP